MPPGSVLWPGPLFCSLSLTLDAFDLLGTDDTDKTPVDCSDFPGAPADLL